jgi:quercetin dioxygenase-like cupin family protein
MEMLKSEDRPEKEVLPDVFHTELLEGERMSFQTDRIEPGGASTEHSHPHEQIDFVISGKLTYMIEGEEYVAEEGDCIRIDSGEVHSGENRGDETFVSVSGFSPPRSQDPFE